MKGIAAAKERGIYKGRKPKIDPAEVRRQFVEDGLSPSAIAKRMRIAPLSVYRFLPTSLRDPSWERRWLDAVAINVAPTATSSIYVSSTDRPACHA